MSLKTLITEEKISARIKSLAQEIRDKIDTGEPVTALVLLNGGMLFASDLLRSLPSHFHLDTLRVSSYGMETESSGQVKWENSWPDFTEKKVLVIDDVLDSGLTLNAVCQKIRELGARQVTTVVAVDKKGRRRIDYEADFVGFTVGQEFLVGYGMDYAEKYRNLPHIAILTED